MDLKKGWMAAIWVGVGVLILLISLLNAHLRAEEDIGQHRYQDLPAAVPMQNPLEGIEPDFTLNSRFSTELPLVVLELDEKPPDYKSFRDGQELVLSEDAYTTGRMTLIDGGSGARNTLSDAPTAQSDIRIKRRGHTSYSYDKKQFLIETLDSAGESRPMEVLGLGEGETWVLSGSMADKSMLRNYLPYRVAAEFMDDAPDCRYCEVVLRQDGVDTYQGVYLMIEAVARGKDRIDIQPNQRGKSYTSYIVRRDRFTNFDTMLETYGRINGLDPEWIGVKYPNTARQTPAVLDFITEDFSKTERVLYSQEEALFKTYDRYIDVDSFVDYFLINEFFGNYDAGNHSTYLYKETGEKLHIGPVWDFDQAMNNYYADEMNPSVMAFQEKPLYRQLVKDRTFLDKLCRRYSQLRETSLSYDHIVALMEQTTAYLTNARQREWYRWAANYTDDSFSHIGSYYLQPYELEGYTLDRFNANYDQELYTIRVYLNRHGKAISTELPKLYDMATVSSGALNEKTLLLCLSLLIFLMPAILINRRS